jgi:hypothetical protein
MTSLPLRPKLLAASALAAGLLALPAAADAATNFGSRLNHDPANSGECTSPPAPCTLVSFIQPSPPNGDPYSGGAPVGGVITKFRIRAFGEGGAAATVTFRLANISLPDPNDSDNALATAAGTGPTVTIPAFNGAGDVPIREFPARLRVKKGNHLALDGTNVWATVNNSGSDFTYRFTPPLTQGQGPRGSNEATGELLVAATIEPDADRDGFGDETQDQCPSQKGTHGPCVAPKITKVRVKGKRIKYRLNQPASMRFKFQRRKSGGKRFKAVGSFKASGKKGANSHKIPKRIRRKLGSGQHRVVIVARNAAGQKTTVRKRF